MPGVPVVYLLHSGDLFGTERMALETLDGLGVDECITISPQGPFQGESSRRGYQAMVVDNAFQLLLVLIRLMRSHNKLVLFSTTVVQAFMVNLVNLVYRRRIAHLHVVHGGDDEHSSYGRKKWLNWINVLQIAVSEFVREKLIQNGVKPGKIRVIENFISECAQRRIRVKETRVDQFGGRGLVIARLVVHKRIELLIDTLAKHRAELKGFTFDVFGSGDLDRQLESRVRSAGVPVRFRGYAAEIADQIADYDFLVHLNHEEPFGLVVLEAMAAGIPVLVPDQGGAATIVRDHENGFTFKSNSTEDLAMKLRQIALADRELIRSIVATAYGDLKKRYSAHHQICAYQKVIEEAFQ